MQGRGREGPISARRRYGERRDHKRRDSEDDRYASHAGPLRTMAATRSYGAPARPRKDRLVYAQGALGADQEGGVAQTQNPSLGTRRRDGLLWARGYDPEGPYDPEFPVPRVPMRVRSLRGLFCSLRGCVRLQVGERVGEERGSCPA